MHKSKITFFMHINHPYWLILKLKVAILYTHSKLQINHNLSSQVSSWKLWKLWLQVMIYVLFEWVYESAYNNMWPKFYSNLKLKHNLSSSFFNQLKHKIKVKVINTYFLTSCGFGYVTSTAVHVNYFFPFKFHLHYFKISLLH